jgi:hypothetical protein
MKHVCVAARIGDGEALGAANIVNIRKASNNASADSGRNPGNDRSENRCGELYRQPPAPRSQLPNWKFRQFRQATGQP